MACDRRTLRSEQFRRKPFHRAATGKRPIVIDLSRMNDRATLGPSLAWCHRVIFDEALSHAFAQIVRDHAVALCLMLPWPSTALQRGK